MALTPDRAAVLHQMSELEAGLAGVRFTERLAANGVSVVVDGKGRLIELRIEDAALRGAHPELIGPGVVTALATARARASTEARARMAELTERMTAGGRR